MKKFAAIILIALSFVGILDAGYLVVKHYTGGTVVCTLTDCSTVLQSPYALMFGQPVALYGLVFYVSVFLLSFLYVSGGGTQVWRALTALSVAGFLFTLYFLYLQALVIRAYCQYCLLSAALATLILITTTTQYRAQTTQ